MALVKREYYIDKLRALKDENLIKVLTGVRRSGKSTLLRLFIQDLKDQGVSEKHIVFINFEDPEYSHDADWFNIYESINKRLDKKEMNYIFLDEVQYVPNFERILVGLQTKNNVDLYVTGSNAHLLSSELATLLSGRSFEINVTPYSFSEFIEATKAITEKQTNEDIFETYLTYGGFPQVAELLAKEPGMISDYLKGVYETIAGRDIMDRGLVSNKITLNNITNFLLNSIGSYSTNNSIANGLPSGTSHHTIPDYLNSLTDSYLFYPANHIIAKGKELLRPQTKYYAVDPGLRYALIGKGASENMGRMLENIIFLELLRRRKSVRVGKVDDKEVDFVTQDSDGNKDYYQVSWTVRGKETLNRELEPLKMIKDYSPKYLLTMDPEEPNHNGIKQLNIVKWLIGES